MAETASRLEMTRQSFLEESASLRFSSPLFSALARACAADDDILELSSVVRDGQPVGLFMPLIAQYLLFNAPDPKLTRYFPSLTDTPEPVDEAFPAFREFCLDQRRELMRLLASRTANTNLVERASCILPALRYVNRLTGEPLTLVEVCCSSALNLLFDEYHYDYGEAGRLGANDSAIQLECKLIGPARPPIDAIPEVAARVGVDIVGIDPADPLERSWMQAMLCPEWKAELRRLKLAQSVRAARELRIIVGDALAVLPSLIDELPGSLCVLHSYGMGQWSAASKIALEEVLCGGSRRRDIHRVGIEEPNGEPPAAIRERLAKLTSAGIPMVQKCLPSRIEHTFYATGKAKSRLLGNADGFGAWLDWHVPPGDVA